MAEGMESVYTFTATVCTTHREPATQRASACHSTRRILAFCEVSSRIFLPRLRTEAALPIVQKRPVPRMETLPRTTNSQPPSLHGEVRPQKGKAEARRVGWQGCTARRTVCFNQNRDSRFFMNGCCKACIAYTYTKFPRDHAPPKPNNPPSPASQRTKLVEVRR